MSSGLITDRYAFDEKFSTGATSSPATAVMPIDFSDGSSHDVFNATISGGLLGANGFIEILIGGAYAASAARTMSLAASSTSVVTQNLNLASMTFEGRVLIQNVNSEASQRGLISLVFGITATAPQGPYLTPISTSTDTSTDWNLQVAVDLSGAVTTAYVGYIRTNTQYIG